MKTCVAITVLFLCYVAWGQEKVKDNVLVTSDGARLRVLDYVKRSGVMDRSPFAYKVDEHGDKMWPADERYDVVDTKALALWVHVLYVAADRKGGDRAVNVALPFELRGRYYLAGHAKILALGDVGSPRTDNVDPEGNDIDFYGGQKAYGDKLHPARRTFFIADESPGKSDVYVLEVLAYPMVDTPIEDEDMWAMGKCSVNLH